MSVNPASRASSQLRKNWTGAPGAAAAPPASSAKPAATTAVAATPRISARCMFTSPTGQRGARLERESCRCRPRTHARTPSPAHWTRTSGRIRFRGVQSTPHSRRCLGGTRGSPAVKTALVAFAALAVVATAACAPLPKPLPPLVVNTTANTFDGVCDAEDCSLLDAIHTANGRVNTNNLPNQIHLGEGTYVLDGDAPVEITRAVVINGRGKALTTIDLTSSPITAPGAVLDTSAPTVITDVRIESGAATPTHVLASCAGHAPTAVSLINVDTDNLAAVSTACDAVFVSTKVSGPASAITPNTISGTTSTLPFPDEPLVVRRFSFVGTRITGPTLED